MGNWSVRLKNWMKRVLLICIVALAIGVTWMVWANYRAGERVRTQREEIAQAGHPLHLAELDTVKVSDDQNAAIELQRWKDELPVAVLALMGTTDETSPLFEYDPLTAAEIQKYSAIVASHQAMIDELILAAGKPYLQRPLNLQNLGNVLDKSLENAQSIRSVARVLTADVHLNIAVGKLDRAMQEANAILNWSRLTSQQPTLVNHLVMVAVQSMGVQAAARVLYAGDVNDAVLAQLRHNLEAYDVNEVWKKCLYSEIPFFVDIFHPTLPAATRHFWFSLNAEADYLSSMRMIAEAGVVRDGRWSDALPNTKAGFGSSWMFASLTPALRASQDATVRSEVLRRCLLALLKWRRDGGKGTQINELQLTTDLLKDPFSSENLKLKATEFGPIIYSVGANKLDDGGDMRLIKDLGLAPVEVLLASESELE